MENELMDNGLMDIGRLTMGREPYIGAERLEGSSGDS